MKHLKAIIASILHKHQFLAIISNNDIKSFTENACSNHGTPTENKRQGGY